MNNNNEQDDMTSQTTAASDNQPTGKRASVLRRWLPLLIIAGLSTAAYAAGLDEYITLERLQQNSAYLREQVGQYPLLSALAFIGTYIAFTALSIPAGTLLTLLSGFLFGAVLGTLYVVTGATLGATIIFLIARSSLGKALREEAGNWYTKVEANMRENAVGYLFFMRLVPVFPFVVVNVIPAFFNVPLRVFLLTTFFGIMPGSFVYVNLGEQLSDIQKLSDLATMDTLAAFGLLGLFALTPTLVKYYRRWRGKKQSLPVITALLVSLMTNATMAEVPEPGNTPYQAFLGHYDELLNDYVHDAEHDGIAYHGVDYDGWAADARHEQARKLFLQTDPGLREGRDERMAYWINAYNFLTISLIIREGQPKSIKDLGGLFTSPWQEYSWELAGETYTLHEIEHQILRPMGDPRIHFAINCASISCPDLRREAYRGERLDSQLAAQVRHTLQQKGKGVRIDGKTVYVSRIFDWFAEDFSNGDVLQWLRKHLTLPDDPELAYMSYDWGLNDMPE